MYELEERPEFVMGWCGQAASLGYPLQDIEAIFKSDTIPNKAQQSLDFLSNSPFNENGVHLKYVIKEDKWGEQHNVSQGQAMYNFAKAIKTAKKTKNTIQLNERFYIAPLCLAAENFKMNNMP